MKNILAILPSDVLYGKERSNIEVYKLLKKKGYDLKIVVNKELSDALRKELDEFEIFPVTFPVRGIFRFRVIKYIWAFLKVNVLFFIIIIKKRPDILFFNTESSFYDLYPSLLFFRKKILYRIGDEPKFPIRSFRKYNSYVWYSYVVKKVDTFVCISKFIQEAVQKLGRKAVKDVIIYNYPPSRSGNYSRKLLTGTKKLDTVVFGYIGQIKAIKGVQDFVMASIELLKEGFDGLFLIAGSLDYDPEFSHQLLDMIPSAFKEKILFTGELEEVASFYHEIDILCVPSIKQEPLGNVIVEAKQFAKAVIIYPSGGMPELVQTNWDGYICKDSTVDSLIEGMKYYHGKRALIEMHGENAKQSIAILGIDRESFERKWIQVFENL